MYNIFMDYIEKFVKDLRINSTEPEQILWHVLRNRRFCNVKFRRQVNIGKYIVDFIAFEKRLVIELDGSQHLTDENIIKDNERTEFLNSQGYRVVRYFNDDILHNLTAVLEDLWDKLNN